jgi:hypothetical protein
MDKSNFILTKELLQNHFDYKDGNLYWKTKGTGILRERAGWVDRLGYVCIGFKRKTYKAHRLIYLMHHGYLPKTIDHIDGNPNNNQIKNLREAQLIENTWNQKKRSTNTTGVKGISYSKKANKYTARCMSNGISFFIGQFDKIEDATQNLMAFRNKAHGSFARHE